jgi:DNA-directed RNA polymerase subunit RPC12/RpoP
MRCPKCSHEQKYKDGMKCVQCGYRFVFNPKTDKLRDNVISQMIQQLSDNGHYYFTRTQLATEIGKYWRKQKIGPIGFVIIVMIFWSIISAISEFSWFMAVAIFSFVVLPLTIFWAIRRKNRIAFKDVQASIQNYHKIHPIEQMVNGKAFVETPDNPIQSKPKISSLDFSLDNPAAIDTQQQEWFLAPEHILIVERDDIVDMLIRNRFHLETKTLVVSFSGYPTSAFKACPGFIKNNPNMSVQVLHDASVNSFGFIHKIRGDAKWRFARENLVDLGLSRKSLADKSELRPWLSGANSDKVIFSKDFNKMLREGRSFPIDSLPPKPLLNQLSAAVVAGALTFAVAETFLELSHDNYG